MTGRSGVSDRGRGGVSPAVVIGLGVALLAFLAYLFYAQFLRTPPLPPQTDPNKSKNWLATKAQEVGGDYSKLSPEDQKQADGYSYGHGREAIKNAYGKAAQ